MATMQGNNNKENTQSPQQCQKPTRKILGDSLGSKPNSPNIPLPPQTHIKAKKVFTPVKITKTATLEFEGTPPPPPPPAIETPKTPFSTPSPTPSTPSPAAATAEYPPGTSHSPMLMAHIRKLETQIMTTYIEAESYIQENGGLVEDNDILVKENTALRVESERLKEAKFSSKVECARYRQENGSLIEENTALRVESEMSWQDNGELAEQNSSLRRDNEMARFVFTGMDLQVTASKNESESLRQENEILVEALEDLEAEKKEDFYDLQIRARQVRELAEAVLTSREESEELGEENDALIEENMLLRNYVDKLRFEDLVEMDLQVSMSKVETKMFEEVNGSLVDENVMLRKYIQESKINVEDLMEGLASRLKLDDSDGEAEADVKNEVEQKQVESSEVIKYGLLIDIGGTITVSRPPVPQEMTPAVKHFIESNICPVVGAYFKDCYGYKVEDDESDADVSSDADEDVEIEVKNEFECVDENYDGSSESDEEAFYTAAIFLSDGRPTTVDESDVDVSDGVGDEDDSSGSD